MLSLGLTKHHTMKTYPYLIKHQAMKTYCGHGGIALRILNLGTRWR
jgi:hypothetical protein